MRIIALGDLHMHTDLIDRIPGITEADLVLVTGDLTNFGGQAEAARVADRLTVVTPHWLALFGNLDQPPVAEFLVRNDRHLHGCGRIVHGLGLVGVGGSNPTPFDTPSEFSEEEIAAILDRGITQLRGHRPFILVAHPPPARTRCDRLASGAHVGSSAVRAFIEKWQPPLCLTGHIHEARATDTIGACTVINPGMLQEGGYVEVEFTDGAVRSHLRQL